MRTLWLAVLLLASASVAYQAPASSLGSIEGIVVDGRGRPIPHAEITPDDGSFKATLVPYYPADARGRFRITGLHSGDWMVLGRKIEAGYMDQGMNFAFLKGHGPLRVHVDDGKVTAGIVLRLGPKAAFVHIALIDSATSQPIHDLQFHMEHVDSPGNYLGGGQGAPADILIPPTQIKLSITSPGYDTWTGSELGRDYVTFKSGEHRTFIVRLNRRESAKH